MPQVECEGSNVPRCPRSGAAVQAAAKKGLVSEQDITTAAERVLVSQFRLGLYDPPEASPWGHLGPEVLGSHVELANEVAAKGAQSACMPSP